MKINAKKILNRIEQKESVIREGIDKLKPSDLTKSDKLELIEQVENLIDKAASLKADLQDDTAKRA